MAVAVMQFTVLAAVVAIAGTFLARSADQIAEITRLGRLLIGSVLLAAATSLPELTVGVGAIRREMPDLAVGDMFGSSLMNLLILAGLDLIYSSGGKMLSRESAAHALSATLGIALTALAGLAILAAPQLPRFSLFGIGGWSWGILVAYLLGVRMIFIDQRVSARAANEAAERKGFKGTGETDVSLPLWKPAIGFLITAIVLFIAGPRLAEVAGELAEITGLGRTFFGTTLLAISTSLPELVASIAAMRMKVFDLVVGNLLGSNAFNMVLLFPLDAAHSGSLLADLSPSQAITAFAVIVATAVAILGQLYHVEKRRRIVEPDAVLMLIILAGALFLVFQLTH